MIAFNFAVLVSLIIGGFLGSYLGSKLFGKPKYGWAVILEILVYAFVIILVFTFSAPTKIAVELVVFYFGVGVFALLLSRAISTGLGFLANKIEEKTGEKAETTREEKLIINVAAILFYYGLSEEKVKETLVSAGFKKSMVENILATRHFEKGVNPLVKRIAELEAEIRRLKSNR